MNLSPYRKILTPVGHLAGWAAFTRLMFLEDPMLSGFFQRYPFSFAGNILLLAGYFYLNMYWLTPRLLSRKKIAAYAGVTLLCLAVICFAAPWLSHALHSSLRPHDMPLPPRGGALPPDFPRPPHRPHDVMQRLSLYTHFVQFLIVFIVSTGAKVLTQWYREKQQLRELEKSRVQAELSFLKSQIHPHFLFNCLNSIYYLALSKNDNAPKTILSLSDFLRFVITESDSPLIPLEKEIRMLEEYLNLQSLRTSEKFELQFIKNCDSATCSIMPLTFIPFVENAFKYGLSAHSNCFVHIRLETEGGKLHFACDNSIMPVAKNYTRSPGVGLDNIRKRLQLAYPGRYLLNIGEDSAGFHVNLQITLL